MRYRKLRIAWSMAWGVLAVLMCVLCVRSYWYRTCLFGTVGTAEQATITAVIGELHVNWHTKPDAAPDIGFADGYPAEHYTRVNRYHFYYGDDGNFGTAAVAPLWFVTFALASLAALPWLPRRFSLRALFIATTLVAVGLGLVVWMATK